MPEEIRGSSFLRMTGLGNPPNGTSAPWQFKSTEILLREAHPSEAAVENR